MLARRGYHRTATRAAPAETRRRNGADQVFRGCRIRSAIGRRQPAAGKPLRHFRLGFIDGDFAEYIPPSSGLARHRCLGRRPRPCENSLGERSGFSSCPNGYHRTVMLKPLTAQSSALCTGPLSSPARRAIWYMFIICSTHRIARRAGDDKGHVHSADDCAVRGLSMTVRWYPFGHRRSQTSLRASFRMGAACGLSTYGTPSRRRWYVLWEIPVDEPKAEVAQRFPGRRLTSPDG